MIQFEKVAGRWNGWRFLRQPDYEFAECQRSVMRPGHEADRPNDGDGQAGMTTKWEPNLPRLPNSNAACNRNLARLADH